MTKRQKQWSFLSTVSIIVLLISTIIPGGIFSFNVSADERDPRTDGVQRITANNLVWTPVSDENPLGGADDFNAILFDRFSNFNETGGAVATGTVDNVDIITFDEGLTGGINQFNDYSIPRYNVGIIVQDSIPNKAVRVSNGDAVIGDNIAEEKVDKVHPTIKDEGSVFVDQSQVDQFMADAKADLTNLNETLWDTPTTGTAEVSGNNVKLDVKKGVNVFEVDPSGGITLNIDYDANVSDSTIIIKATNNSVKINSTVVNGAEIANQNIDSIVNRVLWVFDPAASTMNVSGSPLWIGSVLASNTDVSLNDGYSSINGTIIANSLVAVEGSRSSEFHYTGRFMGNLPTNEPVEKEKVTPVNPVVEQAYCDEEGNPVDPTVELADTEGITYEIEGDVEAGNTVTVIATAEEGYELTETDGWELQEDGTATYVVELDDVNCEDPVEEVTPVNPVVEQAYCDDEEGTPVGPTVDLADTEGITYEIDGEVEAGNTVTIIATPNEGYELTETDGWELQEDGTATYEVKLDEANCTPEDTLVELVDPIVTQAVCTEDGEVIEPTIELPTVQEGLEYEVDGEVKAGESVTIRVIADEGYIINQKDGWIVSEDGKSARTTVTLDPVECTEEPLEGVAPVNPVVEQAYCDEDGNEVGPVVTPADTEGIEYTINGDVEAGNTVTVIATAEEGYELSETDGWELQEDGTVTYVVELDDVNCEDPVDEVTPVNPVVEQAYCDEDGNEVGPVITPVDTEGIEYTIEGDLEAGNTVTVIATPEEGYELTETDSWELQEDRTAIYEVVLEELDCEEPKLPEEPTKVTPEDPVVVDSYCDEDGNPVNPSVTPNDTEGITYEVVGEVKPGSEVTVTAKPKEGYVLDEFDGWVLNEDGTATKTIVLGESDCKDPVNVCETNTVSNIQVRSGEKGTGTVQKSNADNVSYVLKQRPENGQVIVDNVTGDWEYVSRPGYVGEDSFVIITIDEEGNILCEETVNVTVVSGDSVIIDSDKTPEDTNKGDGAKLPKTATNVFNGLLIGLISFVLGATLLFARRKENEQA